jgi:glycerophosphoryl diester phosphodiesterase
MPVEIGSGMVREALKTFRASWRRVVAIEIVFKLLGFVLGVAASSAVLAWVELRSGGASVTNTDLVHFLTRPLSVVLLLVIVGGSATLVLLEQAVLLRILSGARIPRGSAREALRIVGATIGRVMRLAFVCVGIVLGVLAGAVALLGALYRVLLAGPDINYYLSAKPPVFLWTAAIGALIALAAAVLLIVLFVRWLLALSITVFEGGSPRRALAQSAARVRGQRLRIALVILVWHGAIAAIWMLLAAVSRPLAVRALDAAEGSTGRAVVTIIALIVLHGLGTATASFVEWVGHALLVLHFYRGTHPSGRSAASGAEMEAARGSEPLVRAAWLSDPVRLLIAAGVLIAVFVVPACILVSRLGSQDTIGVTAHRGASKAAPENTLGAIRAAIDSRCEWAEIDVQETKDGVVVVLHDQDLMRLAKDPRKIADLTYEEARTLDVGSWFDPRFAERLPTLKEAIDLARGKIRLNIELKYYGEGDPRLAPDVARILREEKFDRDCFVASLHYASLAEARKEWPALRTAAIVSARVGDPTRLEVDVLSMNAKLVTTRLLRSAHLRGKEVHVWTIDDPRLATRLMDLGVDNLITNDPAVMVRLRDERGALSRIERLVLAFRVLLRAEVQPPPPATSVPEL